MQASFLCLTHKVFVFVCFRFIYFFIFESEQAGKGWREREREEETESQAGSTLSVQSLTRGSNSQKHRVFLMWSSFLLRWRDWSVVSSHPLAHSEICHNVIYKINQSGADLRKADLYTCWSGSAFALNLRGFWGEFNLQLVYFCFSLYSFFKMFIYLFWERERQRDRERERERENPQ